MKKDVVLTVQKATIGLVLFLSPLILTVCQKRLPLQVSLKPKISNCNSCHFSPPPTGLHEFHVFQQTARAEITCIECHGSAIRQMSFFKIYKKEFVKIITVWDQEVVDRDTVLKLIYPRNTFPYALVDPQNRYLSCNISIQADTLFSTKQSNCSLKVIVGSEDSIGTGPGNEDPYNDFVWVYPFKDSVRKINCNPFTNLCDTTYVRSYKNPVPYSVCQYSRKDDTLFFCDRVRDTTKIKVLKENDTLFTDSTFGIVFVFSPDSLSDSLVFNLRKIDKTPYSILSLKEQQKILTSENSQQYILEKLDNTVLNYYQLSGDTLFRLSLQQSLDYEDSIFAMNSALHNNGRIDIFFSNETTTNYRVDTITLNDPYNPLLKISGAWRPERLSCMSEGVKMAQCHERINGETFWYEQKAMKLKK